MERQVRVFVEGQKLDLFNDETIEITSTIQNIQDISKTYTDFSQSFTIPTSPVNNAIWEYFYENAVTGNINYQERLNGFIEIDMTFFRRGKIQMEKSQLKNGQADSYTITFYGDVTTLKDLIGEDLLSVLNHTSIDHAYSFTEVYNRITDASIDWDVCYPLITSSRIWQYQGTDPSGNFPNWLNVGSGNNISANSGAIDYRELFPAVRVKSIFDLISNQYGITFTGNFLSDPRFTQAYIWYKNRNDYQFVGQSQDVMFSTILSQIINPYDLSPAFNLTNGELTIQFLNGALDHTLDVNISSNSNLTVPFYLDAYVNGSLFTTWQCLGFTLGGQLGANVAYFVNQLGLNEVYTFKLRATSAVNISLRFTYTVNSYIGSTIYLSQIQYKTTTLNLTSFTDLQTLAPQIKITDFVSGILKQFNLTCFAEKEKTYKIIPLADWYAGGAVINITEFTDKQEIGIERVKLYKKIGFKFQDSESFMNKKYFENGLKQWGNTEYQYPYDGGEFTLEVPFENLLFNKFTGTKLQLGYSLDSSFSPYIPKPILLYKYGGITLAQHIHYTNGSGYFTNFDYTMFGQDLTDNGINYSINFAPETSSYWLFPIQQSIFATYYFPYLANLFNPKNRLTTVKANLPVSLLTGIQLNDRLIIRDKRYIINQMKTNMVTGVTQFELLNDFMPVNPDRIIHLEPSRNTVSVPITLPNPMPNTGSSRRALFTSSNSDVYIEPSALDADGIINITLPRVRTMDEVDSGSTDETDSGSTDVVDSNTQIFVNITYEFNNGEILEGLIIILR